MEYDNAAKINKIPYLGVLCFTLLYWYSSILYPGGSQANINAESFDWINNYWCNLMSEKALNGKANLGRPYAIASMIVLCLSLMSFFIQFATFFSKSVLWKRLIQWSAILSMFFGCFIFTNYHDLMTSLSSFFGLFVVIGVIREIYHSKLRFYKISTLICLLLLAINNYIYYSHQFIEYLPFIQKISLVMVITWILGLNYELGRKISAL